MGQLHPAEEWLLAELETLRAPRRSPARDPSLGADFACYNITLQPNCFDFAPWLIDAEMTRVREGAPAPLKVGFVSGADGGLRFYYPYQQMMFENVVRPMVPLIGAVEDGRARYGRNPRGIAYRAVVDAAKAGEPAPRFRAPPDVEAPSGAVVITLREHFLDPLRNSQMSEWIPFARWLQGHGERVIFVRESHIADEPLEGFETCLAASRDLHTRMAIYERAKACFFVSNGPWNLVLFTQTPWAMFVDPEKNSVNDPDGWRDFHGVAVGEQFPWSTPQQQVVWHRETFSSLCQTWRQLTA